MFMSFLFTETQRKYQTTERETLSVVKALGEARWLLKGLPFPTKLYTDHTALLKTLQSEDVIGRIARWQLALWEYDLDIYHVPGKDIAIADGLSRLMGDPAMPATSIETEMVSFAAEEQTTRTGVEFMGGDQQERQSEEDQNDDEILDNPE